MKFLSQWETLVFSVPNRGRLGADATLDTMRIPGVTWAWELIISGQGGFLVAEIWMRFYKEWRELLFEIGRAHV